MKPEEFGRLKEILLEAAKLPESERRVYLDDACKDAPELREKVESILQHRGDEPDILKTDGIIPRSPSDATTRKTDDRLIGQTISHYRILEKLGAGGMGVVYKAEDISLKRLVALKFLPAELTRDEEARARFLREAQAAAALDHSNICAVHEIGEGEDLTFIAMAYVEGCRLKDMIIDGPLELGKAIDLSIQIADGLQAAHDKGVLHRDIKPGNVMVTPEGKAKITDFGLAKFVGGTEITTDGTRMGTVSYLSPEQARGDVVDHRTDIWSLGTVMYEIITAQRPFRGDHDRAVIQAILHEDPEPITSSREDVPAEAQWVISRALSKSPDDRYQTAGDLVLDLKALARGLDTESKVELPVTTRPRPSIAVLPFVNMSGDPEDEYFSEGLAEDLITALSRVGDLRVVARTSAFSFKGKDVEASEIGRKLRAETLLEGSVRRSGNRLRIAAQLVNAVDGYHLWSERYDRNMEDVFAIQDEISLAIVDRLKVKLLGGSKPKAVRRHTENQKAYHLYMKGRNFYERIEVAQALEYYEKAIAEDPFYALPYAGIASIVCMLDYLGLVVPEDALPKAKAMAKKAMEIDDTLGEAYYALGSISLIYDYDWVEAERQLNRGLELDPYQTVGRSWYVSFLQAMGRTDEAMREARLIQDLDPLWVRSNCVVANAFIWERNFEKAIAEFRATLERAPDHLLTTLWLMEAYLAAGMYDDAITIHQQHKALGREPSSTLWRLGLAYGLSGQKTEALEILERLNRLSEERYVQSSHKALVYFGLGRYDEGFASLEKAYLERDPYLAWLRHPLFDPYRSDQRLIRLLKKMRLDD